MPKPNTPPVYGPENPHPLSKLKTELVWEGKYDEYGNRRPVKLPVTPLPLQRIETIDEPRDRKKAEARQLGLPFGEDEYNRTAHRDDFRNMLIWGDNKLALAALLQEYRGKVDLIYIDPPFDVGADFTMQVQLGEEGDAVEKEQSILEAVAYRDTWGKGTDSYLHMMYERLTLMRDLLSERGSIYVHCDWRVSGNVRSLLELVFGTDQFQNELVWKRATPRAHVYSRYPSTHDVIFYFTKTHDSIWNPQYVPHSAEYIEKYYRYVDEKTGRRYSLDSLINPNPDRPTLTYEWGGVTRVWRYTRDRMQQIHDEGRIYYPKDGGVPRYKRYLDEMEGVPVTSIWSDIPPINSQAYEDTSYSTQKPEALLERIIKASSNEGDLVADFFCGSGTTLAVAEKLGRRWIGVDLGRYAVHTSRKRLIQMQRDLEAENKPYRSFDVYNLGRYERQWWQVERLKGADDEHRKIVLEFYKAAPLPNAPNALLHGKKGGAYVHVDRIDSIFTYEELGPVAQAAEHAGGRELHVLAWEFEMELALKKQAIEAETGLTIRLKYIPREIMEPNRTEAQFFEAGALEVKPIKKGGALDVQLVNFIPSLAEAPEDELDALRKRAVKSPFDFIDFWAVDFDWRADKPFEQHWQDFRTRKDRSLKTRTDLAWKYEQKGKHKICVKVIDVFGVDTTTVLEV